jgi:DNA-binding CsgD family transcriptional regulator
MVHKEEGEMKGNTPIPHKDINTTVPLLFEPEPGPVNAAQPGPGRLEKPEGTMSTQSAFYIERASDRIVMETIQWPGVTITIKGPRQMGKSSLLIRAREQATKTGKKVALLDFQLFDRPALTNPDLFFQQFCDWLSDELEMESRVNTYWKMALGNTQRTTRYVQRYLLTELNRPLVLAMDEVDRIFDAPFRSDFFSMLRSWHNSRQTNYLWERCDLVLVTSTEPYQLIEDLNQSPFNVGEVVELVDFNHTQVAELNRRYNNPLIPEEVDKLLGLLGGHPYLVRRALYLIATERITAPALFAEAADERGPFGDHLRNHLSRLYEREELVAGMKQVLHKQQCQDARVYFRLRGAGLVKREGRSVIPRCKLYADFFRQMSLKPGKGPPVEASSPLFSPQPLLTELSDREVEVLKEVGAGLTNTQIGNKLGLSSHTINSHLTTIYSKLEVNSRVEAARYAIEYKLL